MLQERGYVAKEGRALRATSRGRVLSAFLQQYFAQYVDYSFTSDMEAQLDDIAGGVPSPTPPQPVPDARAGTACLPDVRAGTACLHA